MKKCITLFGILLVFLSAAQLHAQQENQYRYPYNNIWTFGRGYGLDFSSGTPDTFRSQIAGIRAAATLSNEKGELLCYSSGDTVWNKDGEVMPGSLTAILPAPYSVDGSGAIGYGSLQGALFVPVIDNPDRFYLFSMQSLETLMDSILGGPTTDVNFQMVRLFYSVIDMTLDNGKGDIVPGMKGIQMDSLLGAPMIAIPGEDCNIWLLTHQANENKFRAYEITAAGIAQSPVISSVGHLTASLIEPVEFPVNLVFANATMKVSPNNRKLALCSSNWIHFEGELSEGMELFDFDPATGIVSNGIVLDSVNMCWSACFSPDNSKLYVNRDDVGLRTIGIDQYDLTWPTTEEIIEYKTVISDSLIERSDMKLGPDGKIYVNSIDTGYLHVIESPDLADTLCSFKHNVVQFQPAPAPDNISVYYGFLMAWTETLPNDLVFPVPDTLHGARLDTLLPESGTLTLKAPQGRFIRWSDGSEDSVLTVSAAGTYLVGYGTGRCIYTVDTFVVEAEDPFSVQKPGAAAQAAIVAFPNPAQELIYVSISGLSGINGTLILTDALGRIVRVQTYNQDRQAMYVQGLPNGLYNLKYRDYNGVFSATPVRVLIAR